MNFIVRTIFTTASLAIGLGLFGQARAQHANDIELSVDGNGPIVTSGGDYSGTYAGRVFEGIMPAVAPLRTSSPGFDSIDGTFPAGAQIRFDFVKQLLYWNGTELTAPTSSLTVSSGTSNTATIGGGDIAGLPGFVIAPADAQGALRRGHDPRPRARSDRLHDVRFVPSRLLQWLVRRPGRRPGCHGGRGLRSRPGAVDMGAWRNRPGHRRRAAKPAETPSCGRLAGRLRGFCPGRLCGPSRRGFPC